VGGFATVRFRSAGEKADVPPMVRIGRQRTGNSGASWTGKLPFTPSERFGRVGPFSDIPARALHQPRTGSYTVATGSTPTLHSLVDGPARAGEKGTPCAPAGPRVRGQVGGCSRNCQRRVAGPPASIRGEPLNVKRVREGRARDIDPRARRPAVVTPTATGRDGRGHGDDDAKVHSAHF
jgi:hypothetical protein